MGVLGRGWLVFIKMSESKDLTFHVSFHTLIFRMSDSQEFTCGAEIKLLENIPVFILD